MVGGGWWGIWIFLVVLSRHFSSKFVLFFPKGEFAGSLNLESTVSVASVTHLPVPWP